MMGKIEIGLKLFVSCCEPPLCNETILATFHTDGNEAVSMEQLTRKMFSEKPIVAFTNSTVINFYIYY